MKTQTAEDAYAMAHSNCVSLLEVIEEQLFDMPAPNEFTNWAEVGSMLEIERRLKAVLAFVGEASNA